MKTTKWSLRDLARLNTAFNNCKNPEIKSKLEIIGVGDILVDKGINLHSDIVDLDMKHKNELQEKSQAFTLYKEKRDECQNDYDTILHFVRIATRFNSNLSLRIRTTAIPENPVDEWPYQIDLFYESLEKEPFIMNFLKERKFPDDIIRTNRAKIKTLIDLRSRVDTEKGQAEDVRRERDSKFAELTDLWWELKSYAVFALKDTPQLLEELGIKVKS
ncbi:MAG: hypothetical protein N4A72_17325 [Bacteroidales bacterium]|jgi:hypothetical protein|nr:hypothetical protein [Bacteroidales bacterium]